MHLSQQIKIARWLLLVITIAFAFWRFSEPTADPDLWGHALYGQRTISSMEVERAEPFSWTSQGHNWINHEQLAEITMGATHWVAGSSGLFWLMVSLSFAAFLYAIRLGLKETHHSIIAWVIGLLLCREAAIGFSMRPQLFSALYFVIFLGSLRALFNGARWPVIALPIMLCAWINTHGAALLALILLLVAVGAQAMAPIVTKLTPAPLKPFLSFQKVSANTWRALLGTTLLCWLAVGITPYGYDLLMWLIDSVRYVRPEITEWNPTALSAQHLLFFISFPVFAVLACINRNDKRPWEIGTLTVLFIAAFRHERHIPLYSLAYIAIAPSYIDTFLNTDSIKRWADNNIQLNAAKLFALNCILIAATLTFAWQGLSTKFTDGFQMQVPRDEYPVSAMEYLQANQLDGNLIVNFNWAQMAIWELPTSRVSFDGRLDTCYPRDLIEAHWALYYDGKIPEDTFDFNQADLALIPPGIALNDTLKALPSWQLIYQDPLAKIYLNRERNADWKKATQYRKADALVGNAGFPNERSELAVLEATHTPQAQ